MNSPADVAAKLRDAVARLIGPPGDIVEVRRLTAGATKATWAFTAQIGDARQALILQVSGSANQEDVAADGAEKSPRGRLPLLAGKNDAEIMQAAAEAGVPVPRVRAILTPECGLGEGYITDFVPGETIARRILREPRFSELRSAFASQCGEVLAHVHAIDAASVPFLESLDGASQIALYREIYDGFDYPVPLFEVAFRWAEDNLPAAARTTVMHGDFRMGNLICGEQRIHAVLDWELACIGDPMQDLGWLCVRTWRFGGPGPVGGIGSRADLIAAYERAAGVAVDPSHVRFWEGWGCIRWAIMCMMKGLAHRTDARQRTVEAFAIGRRMEEPLFDFLEFLGEEKAARVTV
jgi:aminoglycoside phosphotransferase (APT) family kinase protein